MQLTTLTRATCMVVVALAFAACGGTETTGDAATIGSAELGTPTSDEQVEWLFAIQSLGPSTFDETRQRLSIPTDAVHAFTDRPHRDTQVITPQGFANLWHTGGADSFTEDPPNAVLTYWDQPDGGIARTVVCEVIGDVNYSSDDGVLTMGLAVLDADAPLPTTLYRASLFVDDVDSPCEASPVDEDIVEYFNVVNYQEEIEIVSRPGDAAGTFEVGLQCPAAPDPSMPPSDFELALSTVDGSASTSCGATDGMVITPSTGIACNGRAASCKFEVTLSNRSTGTVYSQTLLTLDLDTQTVIAALDPATVPICSDPQTSGPRPLPG